jgi:hypothetical protein
MKNLLPLFLSSIIAGCAVNPDVAMKLEKSPQTFRVLMGEFEGALALIHGSIKNAKITATDGEVSCTGESNNGEFKTDMRKNVVTHVFDMKCSTGETGKLILKITLSGGGNASGAGVGNMSDGSKLKVVVGDMAGTLSW